MAALSKIFRKDRPCCFEVPLVVGVICGCASGNFPVFCSSLAAVAAAGLFFGRRASFFMLAGVLLGAGSLVLHGHLESRARRELPERRAGLELVCRCTDTRLTACPGIPAPASFTARIEQVGTKRCFPRPKITVRIAEKGPFPRYGDVFSARGAFTPVGLTGSWGKFLSSRGFSGTWEIEKISSLSRRTTFVGTICRLRDKIMTAVLRGVASDRARIIAGALFFGTSGGFDKRMRDVYLRAGTLHLFSISGMHIAAAACLLFWFLRVFPYRMQYLLLAPILTVYAVSTGANPPVVRALIVILFWCAGRIFLAGKSSLELLALAAAIMLIGDPGLLKDTGTQYSFFITSMLILAGRRCGELRRLDLACINALPLCPESLKLKKAAARRWRLILAAAGCCAAFVAGIGISAAHRNLVLPGAVFMNMILLVLMPLLFLLAGARLLFASLLPGPLFEDALLVLDKLCVEGGRLMTPVRLVVSSDAEAVLFCVSLVTAFSSAPKKLRTAGAAAALGLFCLWSARPLFSPAEAAFISGTPDTAPVIVIAEPAENLSFVVNAGSYEGAAAAADFLSSRGAGEPEALLFSSGNAGNAAGVPALLRSAAPRRVRLPDGGSRGLAEKLRSFDVKNPASGDREREFVKIFHEKNSCRLEYSDPGSKLSLVIRWRDTPGGRLVSFDGGPVRSIPWGSTQEILLYGLAR